MSEGKQLYHQKKNLSIYKLLKIVLKIENITNQQDLIVEVIVSTAHNNFVAKKTC